MQAEEFPLGVRGRCWRRMGFFDYRPEKDQFRLSVANTIVLHLASWPIYITRMLSDCAALSTGAKTLPYAMALKGEPQVIETIAPFFTSTILNIRHLEPVSTPMLLRWSSRSTSTAIRPAPRRSRSSTTRTRRPLDERTREGDDHPARLLPSSLRRCRAADDYSFWLGFSARRSARRARPRRRAGRTTSNRGHCMRGGVAARRRPPGAGPHTGGAAHG
jgi:hypothetical protein